MKSNFWTLFFCLLLLLSPGFAAPQTIVLKNDLVRREFATDGRVWRTVKFARADGSDAIVVQSDEFHLLFFDGVKLTVGDFIAREEPHLHSENGTQTLTIRYFAPKGDKTGPEMPRGVTITYSAKKGEPYLRKKIEFEFASQIAVDRLDVERFSVAEKAGRGGRGEPVFVKNWFFGLEYPAGHSRHTDGNTPVADAHHFEKVGNYSDVNLNGHDRDANARPGLLRLFHFPGDAKADGQSWKIVCKTAVAGIGAKQQPIELAFQDYLATIAKPARSFTHYNNWFDPAGKNLRGDNFVNVWRDTKKAIEPYGIKLDAMVPDNGWQNRQSIWEPNAGQFPGGFDDLKKLSENLRREGTSLGLWLSLDGTTNDISWGEKQGYARAKANPYFSQYFAHHSLSQLQYKEAMLAQLRRLVKDAGITYFKHDFNHLSDIGEGNGHPPTDRHGHEANVDAMIEMLDACRKANPQIYQNLTNWMWFSPWWLMHGDAIWMLAGDDGFNGNWPEISSRAMATTDRDVYLWRMWSDVSDRPLLPISRLMTHGIVRNAAGQMESKEDTLADWADHVMMYYGRGVQMKEWYLSPAAMDADRWRVLCSIHKWSEKHFMALTNTVFVGGRPDEGQPYGYVGWDGNLGVLVARNPSAQAQTLRVPCDARTWFRGAPGKAYRARVAFPYRDSWPAAFRSGETMNFELPGYATMAFEIEPGKLQKSAALPVAPKIQRQGASAEFRVPAEAMSRCDLLVIGYDRLPDVKINGETATPARRNSGRVNDFASYARSGMPSDKARPWQMAAFDLRAFRGKIVSVQFAAQDETSLESWLLLERAVAELRIENEELRKTANAPWPPSQNARRQTVQVLAETRSGAATQRALTDAELRTIKSATLTLEVFGVNGGQFGAKEMWLNGAKIGVLPEGGDAWQRAKIAVPIAAVRPENRLEIRCKDTGDKFKFRRAVLTVELPAGDFVRSSAQAKAQTSYADWAFSEGAAFPVPESSAPVTLDFKAP